MARRRANVSLETSRLTWSLTLEIYRYCNTDGKLQKFDQGSELIQQIKIVNYSKIFVNLNNRCQIYLSNEVVEYTFDFLADNI